MGAGLLGLEFSQGLAGEAPASSPTSVGAPVASATPGNSAPNIPQIPPPSPLISPEEFQRLRAAREAALQANPDLAAEQGKINSEMQAQLAKLDAAAIKADPKVAPIMAKLAALRQLGRPHAPSSTPGPRNSP